MGELDNTLIVISGDHGAAGFPRGKCNLYDFGVAVLLAVRMGAEKGVAVCSGSSVFEEVFRSLSRRR